MNEPEKKVHEPEIVGREVKTDSVGNDRVKVEIRRVRGPRFYGQSAFATGGDPEEIRRRVARFRSRLWLWLAAFALVTAGCFYGAYDTEYFVVQVILILTGGLTATVTAFLVFVLWGLHRLANSSRT